MPNISNSINSVTVEFASTVGKDVTQALINGLNHVIKSAIATGHTLNKIYVSSAKDSHTGASRHVVGKAVDISRINGNYISTSYASNATVKAIVDAIQDKFESFDGRRENFGPHFIKKLGGPWPSVTTASHSDHIHLSVN